MSAMEPYSPLNTPKLFAEGVWIVDGPEIRMTYGPVTLPFSTRMTVVRLGDSSLWVHSPIAPDEALFERIEALGEVRHLVAPNSLHYWYMADWTARYPQAKTYAVPDLGEKAKRPFRTDMMLDGAAAPAWENEIAWVRVPGTVVEEAVFHVRASRITILTDLIENFEPLRIRNRFLRLLVKWGGAAGHTPYDLRLTFWPRRRQVARAMETVLGWPTRKVVLAHGQPFEEDGADILRKELKWAARG